MAETMESYILFGKNTSEALNILEEEVRTIHTKKEELRNRLEKTRAVKKRREISHELKLLQGLKIAYIAKTGENEFEEYSMPNDKNIESCGVNPEEIAYDGAFKISGRTSQLEKVREIKYAIGRRIDEYRNACCRGY